MPDWNIIMPYKLRRCLCGDLWFLYADYRSSIQPSAYKTFATGHLVRKETKSKQNKSKVILLRKNVFLHRPTYMHFSKKKVKWSRYRPGVAQRVGRGIALLFHDRGTRRWWVVSSTPRLHFYPRERQGTHCTGGWVGPRAGLDGRKISSPSGFDPGPSSP